MFDQFCLHWNCSPSTGLGGATLMQASESRLVEWKLLLGQQVLPYTPEVFTNATTHHFRLFLVAYCKASKFLLIQNVLQ